MEGKTIDPGTAKRSVRRRGRSFFTYYRKQNKKPRAEKAQGKKGKNEGPVFQIIRRIEENTERMTIRRAGFGDAVNQFTSVKKLAYIRISIYPAGMLETFDE